MLGPLMVQATHSSARLLSATFWSSEAAAPSKLPARLQACWPSLACCSCCCQWRLLESCAPGEAQWAPAAKGKTGCVKRESVGMSQTPGLSDAGTCRCAPARCPPAHRKIKHHRFVDRGLEEALLGVAKPFDDLALLQHSGCGPSWVVQPCIPSKSPTDHNCAWSLLIAALPSLCPPP